MIASQSDTSTKLGSDPFVLTSISTNDVDTTASPPLKKIDSGDDLRFFLSSQAYRDIKLWILQLTRSCLPRPQSDGSITAHRLNDDIAHATATLAVQRILQELNRLVDETPPASGPRRFGNVAFRTWITKLTDLIDSQLEAAFEPVKPESQSEQLSRVIKSELKSYLLASFGSAQRLDYGTGHELSYLAFLGILWRSDYFKVGDEWSIVAGAIQPYLSLVRKLIKQYNLEPAGSHGVWGLDDHSFIPYVLGSAQLATPLPPPTPAQPYSPTPVEGSMTGAPEPASITSPRSVEEQRDSNFYFAAVAFILDVKRGPFFEHSPYLYNISGIKDGWGKINKGMLKMYDAEVLGKFPVVQHFPFGNFWRWERDPTAIEPQRSTMHIQQQPDQPHAQHHSGNAATQSTKAPWASQTAMPPPRSNRR